MFGKWDDEIDVLDSNKISFASEKFTLSNGHRILRHVVKDSLHAFDHQVDFDDRTLSSPKAIFGTVTLQIYTNLNKSIFPKCPSHDFIVKQEHAW